MNDINLTKLFTQKMASFPRVRGRYNVSELFFILNGSTTPEAWILQHPRTVAELLTMWNGTGVHNQLASLFGKANSDVKQELHYKGMVVVGKADYLPPHKDTEVWEFKSSVEVIKEAKPWHKHQAKMYCTMFKKDKGVVYQPVQDSSGLYLKYLGHVDRDDKWTEAQLEKLYQFHLKVEELWKLKSIL